MRLLLVLEHEGEALTAVCARLCANVYRFAGREGHEMAAVLCGDCGDAWVQSLGRYGISKVYHAPGAAEDFYAPEARKEAIVSAFESAGASVLILPGSLRSREVAPLLACRLAAGLVAECVELQWTDGVPEAVVNAYQNQYQRVYRLEGSPQVLVMADVNCGAFAPLIPVATESIILEAPPVRTPHLQVLETIQVPSGDLDITEADIIVGVGRGVATREELEQVEELAAVLGATLGGTRPAVDAGWIGENRQIGQTGKIVAPSLYIAAGVSGAQQHISGIISGTIIAVNKDAQAPVHQAADLGVIGDLKDILPLLIDKLRNRAKEGQQQ